jgi:ribosome biogenesis GTPase / thiamine phosphate phosphatase
MTGKYKGINDPSRRKGMGRLRHAAEKDVNRGPGWERHIDDDHFLDQHGERSQGSHYGESLLASFNRAARAEAAAPAGALAGTISGFQGKALLVRLDNGTELLCEVRQALKKRFAGVKNPFAVGDRVHVSCLRTEAVVVAAEPRRTQLARADSHNKSLIHVLAANVDVLVIVASLLDPPVKPGLIDRYLVIAAANRIAAFVVLNKADLADAEPLVAIYRAIGLPTFITSAQTVGNAGTADLRTALLGRTAVIAGQSGVGKSSLVNALYPELATRVGTVSESTGKGRHTTTAARSYVRPDGGVLIDTPGIRECGITGLDILDVALHYPDIARFHPSCRFADCSHRHEPDCAVLAAVGRGDIAPSRYESYRSIIEEDLGA